MSARPAALPLWTVRATTRGLMAAACLLGATACESSAGQPVGTDAASIALWGDSQTIPGNGYSNELAGLLPSRTIYVEAIGGQRTAMIAARMGAIPVKFVQPVTVPATGCAAFPAKALSVDPLRTLKGTVSARASAGGRTGTLTFTAAAPGAGGNEYQFCASPAASAPLTLDVGTPLTILSGFMVGATADGAPPIASLLKGTVVIRVGRNDLNGRCDLDALFRTVDAMVALARKNGAHTFVIGQMLGYRDLPKAQGGGGNDPAASIALFDQQTRWNAMLAAHYAGNFIDIQKWHVDHGGGHQLSIAAPGETRSFTVLTADASAPKLADGIHENAAGQQETAEAVAAKLAGH